jgi:hypothetical protein
MKGSRTWFNYTPLSTAGTQIKDDGSRVFCSISIERGSDKSALELAFIGDQTKLELIRIKTPETDGDLDEEERRIIGNITDHAIAMLQLVFDPGLGPLYLAGRHLKFGQFGADDGSPQFQVRAEEFRDAVKYDADLIRNAIVATAPIRVQMSLFAEATRPTTPLPFKYLCYYKILELELLVRRKWVGLAEHLAQYEDDYRKLDIGQASLSNLLHSYRDRCAHIKTGGRDELGLIGMGSKDAERVSKFLPLLHRIVVDLLNVKHSNAIVLSPLLNQPGSVSETLSSPSSAVPD